MVDKVTLKASSDVTAGQGSITGVGQFFNVFSADGEFQFIVHGVDGSRSTLNSGGLSNFNFNLPAGIKSIDLQNLTNAVNNIKYLIAPGIFTAPPTVGNLVLNKATSSVTVYGDPDAPLDVDIENPVTVENTEETPLYVVLAAPSGPSTITDDGAKPIAATGGAPTAISTAGEFKLLIVYNPGTVNLYIGGSAVTAASAAIVIEPGDQWESPAPGAAWYAVGDTATTANVTTGI